MKKDPSPWTSVTSPGGRRRGAFHPRARKLVRGAWGLAFILHPSSFIFILSLPPPSSFRPLPVCDRLTFLPSGDRRDACLDSRLPPRLADAGTGASRHRDLAAMAWADRGQRVADDRAAERMV